MNLITTPPQCLHSRTTATDVRMPAADIHETPDLVRIRFNVPGAGPEDLAVSFENQSLVLASKADDSSAGETTRAAIYQRSIRIPRELDAAAMKATLNNGVLEIELPKVARPAAVTIPITS